MELNKAQVAHLIGPFHPGSKELRRTLCGIPIIECCAVNLTKNVFNDANNQCLDCLTTLMEEDE